MGVFLAMALKPFVIFLVLVALLGVRYLFVRFFPDGKLKRLLLLNVRR